ncbi:metallophosphoesterase [Hymenobacter guriensis]|uniref:Serine/threonine protein phosphatase n=1 Tax=Hymenobacter guriensis TaxID=2793065 RepID=A0ABS0L5X4_9BACT|nr:metallophosphoesterase [Hymenobacter guriensis]MBG8555565.1 serine/threonine protein phosphatase [Hymenobacter guriensis]
MNLFVVGDAHGCYYTFKELLRHWQPATELLVQTGDLVDRGRYVPETVDLAVDLSRRYPAQTVFLKGNHEALMLQHLGPAGPHPGWLRWGGRSTLQQYRSRTDLLAEHLPWLASRPLLWENDALFISHAGLADTPEPLHEDNPNGILWRRGPLLQIGKRQIIGHTPTPDGKTLFDAATDALYIDTGAYLGRGLTAVRLSPAGQLLETLTVPTRRRDIS